jgi:hypothetical protein
LPAGVFFHSAEWRHNGVKFRTELYYQKSNRLEKSVISGWQTLLSNSQKPKYIEINDMYRFGGDVTNKIYFALLFCVFFFIHIVA